VKTIRFPFVRFSLNFFFETGSHYKMAKEEDFSSIRNFETNFGRNSGELFRFFVVELAVSVIFVCVFDQPFAGRIVLTGRGSALYFVQICTNNILILLFTYL